MAMQISGILFISRKRVIPIWIFLLAITETNAQVSVTQWHEGRAGALSLNYDDGTKSHYTYLRPVLDRYNLKGSFYLNTSLLSETPVADAHSGSWEEFRLMELEGHEMGSHGVNHPDLTTLPVGDSLTLNTIAYELYESKRVIEEKIGNGYKCITHGYPFCTNNETVRQVSERYFASARSCGGLINSASPNYYALNCEVYDWASTRKSFYVDFGHLKSFINSVESNIISGSNGWGVLVCHEVLPFDKAINAGTWEPTTLEWMIEAAKFLNRKVRTGELWVGTMADVTMYARERDGFTYTLVSEDENTVRYFVADKLDNSVYDFPLTLDITVPDEWRAARVVQGNTVHTYRVKGDQRKSILAAVVPLEDTVEVQRLTDDQLLLLSAEITENGESIHLQFNYPVIYKDTTSTGFTFYLNKQIKDGITAISYANTDSLDLIFSLADPVQAGTLAGMQVEGSWILSNTGSRLGDESILNIQNNSTVADETMYRVLSVSNNLIERNEEEADVNLYVFSTSHYTLELESEWCSISQAEGWEYDTIQVHFTNNLSAEQRTDTIHIASDEGFEEMVVLSQSGFVNSGDRQKKIVNQTNALMIFPSPTSDIISLVIPEEFTLPATVRLLTTDGKQLDEIEMNETILSIDVNGLSSGYYFIQVRSRDSQLSERFLVR